MREIIAVLALASSLSPAAALAQLTATGPVVNGHHHFNAGDVDEHMRFWVDALGGEAGTFGNNDMPIALFPNALIFMRDRAPTDGMIGSTVNHVAFSVNDLRSVVDRVQAAGYRMITESDIGLAIALVTDPWGTSIELTEGLDAIR